MAIAPNIFAGSEDITEVVLQHTIQEGTFQNCGKLNSVKLGEVVSAISSRVDA